MWAFTVLVSPRCRVPPACLRVQVKGLPYATSEEAQARLLSKNINYIDRRVRTEDQVRALLFCLFVCLFYCFTAHAKSA